MVKCPNCGQKTCGDSCQWCKYPLITHRFPWQVRREPQPNKLAEQAELKAEQIIKDAREKAAESATRAAVASTAKAKDTAKTATIALHEATERVEEASAVETGDNMGVLKLVQRIPEVDASTISRKLRVSKGYADSLISSLVQDGYLEEVKGVYRLTSLGEVAAGKGQRYRPYIR